MPIVRQTSATGVPPSACLSTYAICSSEYLERFNGKFRDECLNEHWFRSIAHAREVIEGWRVEYNGERTRSSLGDIIPEEFAAKIASESGTGIRG